MQDADSHTPDRCYMVRTKVPIKNYRRVIVSYMYAGFWSHVRLGDDTDSAFLRRRQLNLTRNYTKELLADVYSTYPELFNQL